MFDWANSAYNLVIVSTIFPAVFLDYYASGVDFFGIHFEQSESLLEIAISVSYLILVFLSPILSGIADYGGYKKRYMQFFSTLGALACAGLYFFTPERLEWGLLCAILASIGFSGSLVFYNAFLPEIVPHKFQDKISAKGFAYGYFGSSLLLILVLVLLKIWSDFKVQYAFLLVGVWWFAWARWTFSVLPNGVAKETEENLISKGLKELRGVWKTVRSEGAQRKFLLAFFMIDLGVQTIVIIAPAFAKKVAGMASEELIVVVLLMQFVGILGSVLFSKLSAIKGNVPALALATGVYLIVCVLAFVVSGKSWFYVIGGLIGLAMGGVQSLARSTYSKLLPRNGDHASFFSFYDIVEKIAVSIGTLGYALILFVVSPRIAVLGLSVFFVIGLFLLFRLSKTKSLNPSILDENGI